MTAGLGTDDDGVAASFSVEPDVEIVCIQDRVVATVLREGRQRIELRSFMLAVVQADGTRGRNKVQVSAATPCYFCK